MDADGDAKAIGERVGSGSYYSRVDRVEAKRVRVDEQRVDGDRVSDNRSAEKTWPWTRSCVPCTSRAVGIQRRAERRETGVSYSIYELKSYNEISTVYIREGETRGDDREGGRAAYSTKAKLRMSKYLLRRDRGRVDPGIKSLIVKSKARGT